jgi:CheY-like chemotaxis protein
MRFRFGWRKEQKNEKQIIEIFNEDKSDMPEDLASTGNGLNSLVILNEQPAQVVTMTTRILVFGDHEELGNLYSLFLRSKGYEVLHFPSPATCALITRQKCTCPRDHVCADILIADMDMEGMTGLDLIRHQKDRGCLALPEHKAVLSRSFTNKQEHEASALGCKTLRKPFRLLDMMEWVKKCEMNIPPDRRLTPHNELLDTAQA